MNQYVPFLKLKRSELGALKELTPEVSTRLSPFFDLPRKNESGYDSAGMKDLIDKAVKSSTKNLNHIPEFYIDDFDLDEDVRIDGQISYGYLIDGFSNKKFIPVVGIDRIDDRISVVYQKKVSGVIQSDKIAIRVVCNNVESPKYRRQLRSLIANLKTIYKELHLVIDCRVCVLDNFETLLESVSEFIVKNGFNFTKVIITGSSIPASIRDILRPNGVTQIKRLEVSFFRELVNKLQSIENIWFGDYTIVSPYYSDLDIDPKMILRKTAPKILYAFTDKMDIMRGGSLQVNPLGNGQYNIMCGNLISKPYFRGQSYSFGDDYIFKKAQRIGPLATPSTILKPLINAHITFMVLDFSI